MSHVMQHYENKVFFNSSTLNSSHKMRRKESLHHIDISSFTTPAIILLLKFTRKMGIDFSYDQSKL